MLLKDIDSKQLKTSIVCCKDLINKIENDDGGYIEPDREVKE